jgi:hypothetical protein
VREVFDSMSAKINPDLIVRLRLLAASGLNRYQIAEVMELSPNWVSSWAGRYNIEVVRGKNPKSQSKETNYSIPNKSNNDDCLARIRALCQELGIVNQCTVRQASAEEMEEFKIVKPFRMHDHFEITARRVQAWN